MKAAYSCWRTTISSCCARTWKKTLRSKLIFQLRYLYMDDPLAYGEAGQENPGFCTTYDMKRQWREFHDECARGAWRGRCAAALPLDSKAKRGG